MDSATSALRGERHRRLPMRVGRRFAAQPAFPRPRASGGSVRTDSALTSDFERHQRERRAHWDAVAQALDTPHRWSEYYHQRLTEVYRFLVPPAQRVLELGCGQADLLAALQPRVGVGIDLSPEMVARAKARHPELTVMVADAHTVELSESFEVIVLSDLTNDLWDVQTVFERLKDLSTPRTRIVMNSYSRLWELPLAIAERLGLAMPTLHQNWLGVEDTANLLALCDFEVIRHWPEIIWPLGPRPLAAAANQWLARLWPVKHAALTNFIVARPTPRRITAVPEPLVSVIVPARNEAGNIAEIVARVPEMGRGTELVFVEGHSTDDTYRVIERTITDCPRRRCQLLRQPGTGKGDAVRAGFARASGDVLMIFDADLTVPPEDLPRFYDALQSTKAEFVNGVRLVYPMEQQAMRFFNLLGNKFFSLAFSWLLGQPIKDTLCGTKVLRKTDYELIAANRERFGDFDPFGDFDLLFGAAKLNLKIMDLPIRYRKRTYGTTNIARWRHGWLLLRMLSVAAARLKFV